jgi:hypothetical protein
MKHFLFAVLASVAIAAPARADTWLLNMGDFGPGVSGPFTVSGTFMMDNHDPTTISNITIMAIAGGYAPSFATVTNNYAIPGNPANFQATFPTTFVNQAEYGRLDHYELLLFFTYADPSLYTVGGQLFSPDVLPGGAEWNITGTLTDATPAVTDHHHHHHHHHHLIDDHILISDDDHDPTTSVPEPATWAMMLLGFAGLGFLAHRRRHETKLA